MSPVEVEMAYTPADQACKDPAIVDGELRHCRRDPRHPPGGHASGFGAHHRTWGEVVAAPPGPGVGSGPRT